MTHTVSMVKYIVKGLT